MALTRKKGTVISYSNAGETLAGTPSPNYNVLGDVFDFSGFQPTKSVIDVTPLSDTSKSIIKRGGDIDGGTTDVTVWFEKSLHTTLKGIFEEDETRIYKVEYPDGSTDEVDALITGLPLTGEKGSYWQSVIPFEVSGKPKFTPAS